jgi:hypothetical protein
VGVYSTFNKSTVCLLLQCVLSTPLFNSARAWNIQPRGAQAHTPHPQGYHQDLKPLLECVEVGMVSPVKVGCGSLTLRDWAMHHQLSSGGNFWTWVVKLGLLFWGRSFWRLQVSKCVTINFINARSLGWDSLSASNP